MTLAEDIKNLNPLKWRRVVGKDVLRGKEDFAEFKICIDLYASKSEPYTLTQIKDALDSPTRGFLSKEGLNEILNKIASDETIKKSIEKAYDEAIKGKKEKIPYDVATCIPDEAKEKIQEQEGNEIVKNLAVKICDALDSYMGAGDNKHMEAPFFTNNGEVNLYKHEGIGFVERGLDQDKPATKNQILHAIRCLGFKQNDDVEKSLVHTYDDDKMREPGPKIATYLNNENNPFHSELKQAVELVEKTISRAFNKELRNEKEIIER